MPRLFRLHNRCQFLLVAIAGIAASAPAYAQILRADKPLPTFAVATIKPGKHITNNAYTFSKGLFRAEDMTITGLIRDAYDLHYGTDDQIFGVPAWANSVTFDIEAKAEEPPPTAWASVPAERRNALMLQELLRDRFKLKLHHETREIRVWALVVAKNGPKLKASSPQSPPPNSTKDWKGIRGVRDGPGHIDARHETTGMFVEFLQYMPEIDGRLVIDKSELTNEYDFTLRWSPDGASPSESAGPALFTALQEQIGLRLESIKAPVDVIVIDAVEMPTEN